MPNLPILRADRSFQSMAQQMKSSLFIAFVLIIWPAAINPVASQQIRWHEDLESASQIAADENKLVLLHFGAEWCRPCKSLETFVFSSPEVQTAMRQNVVAVKIDVDREPNLVKEYGVSGVPFDIAITPQGRVVSKRSSPRDASSYSAMINGFNRVINCLQAEKPAIMEQLNQFGAAETASHKVIKNRSLVPAKPSHTAPLASNNSFELQRKSRVANPYALAAESHPEKKPSPETMQNQFVGATSASKRISGTANGTSGKLAKQVAPIDPGQFPEKMSSTARASITENLANKEIKNQFFVAKPVSDRGDTIAKTTTTENAPSVARLSSVAASNHSQDFAASTFPPEKVTGIESKVSASAEESLYPFKSSLNDVTKKLMPQINSASAPQMTSDSAKPAQSEKLPDLDAALVAGETDLQSPLAQTNNSATLAEVSFGGPADKLMAQKQLSTQTSPLKPTKSVDQVIAETATPGKGPVEIKAEAKLLLPSKTIVDDRRFFEDSLSKQTAAQDRQGAIPSGKTKPGSQAVSPGHELAASQPAEQFALKGKCPVNLLKTGQWIDGDPQWGCVHRNKTYLFSSQANLREFQSNPDAYSPLLAGFDPVIFHQQGKLVDGIEEHGVFMGKSPSMRVILFSSAKTRAAFQANPKAYINTIRQATRSTVGKPGNLLR